MAESAALAGYDVWSLDAFGDLDQHHRRVAGLKVFDDAHPVPLGRVVPDLDGAARGIAG